ncbi:hypothetical protein PYW08_011606 [Mythimna loreyi]|uniref:Uncharacterized protein n=1 Tax=Mythimna loreyi TaxID=667449 RepID=A0ACC2QJZ8_9NEOP|nr:hypothetical protein PYW08_011606 [Mythimna loreyi]
MKGELPVFKRCCFCLPLRYGLLAWGYFKLIADVCLIFMLCSDIFTDASNMIRLYLNKTDISKLTISTIIDTASRLTLELFALTLFFANIVVTILFIIGGHKKNAQFMRGFYFLSMGIWMATFLWASDIVVVTLWHGFVSSNYYFFLDQTLKALCFFFVILVVQTYFLLLLRSEMIKLRNFGEFRFVNNAAEAECTMRCEEVVVATEMMKPD